MTFPAGSVESAVSLAPDLVGLRPIAARTALAKGRDRRRAELFQVGSLYSFISECDPLSGAPLREWNYEQQAFNDARAGLAPPHLPASGRAHRALARRKLRKGVHVVAAVRVVPRPRRHSEATGADADAGGEPSAGGAPNREDAASPLSSALDWPEEDDEHAAAEMDAPAYSASDDPAAAARPATALTKEERACYVGRDACDALQRSRATPETTRHGARCPVVAKFVQTASARAPIAPPGHDGQRKAETPTQSYLKSSRLDGSLSTGWDSLEPSASANA